MLRRRTEDQQELPGILVGGKVPGVRLSFRPFELVHMRTDAFTDFCRIVGLTNVPQYLLIPYNSEDAIEHNELAIFLRLNDNYDPSVEEDRPLLEEKVIGVPGATNASPLKFKGIPSAPASTPSKLGGSSTSPGSPAAMKVPPPTPVNRRNEFDVGEELVGYGLQVCLVAALVHHVGSSMDRVSKSRTMSLP